MKTTLKKLALVLGLILGLVVITAPAASAGTPWTTAHFSIYVKYCGGSVVTIGYSNEQDMLIDFVGLDRRMSSGVSGYVEVDVINTDLYSGDSAYYSFLSMKKPSSVGCTSQNPNGTSNYITQDGSKDNDTGEYGYDGLYCGGYYTGIMHQANRANVMGNWAVAVERQYLGYSGTSRVRFLDQDPSEPTYYDVAATTAGNC